MIQIDSGCSNSQDRNRNRGSNCIESNLKFDLSMMYSTSLPAGRTSARQILFPYDRSTPPDRAVPPIYPRFQVKWSWTFWTFTSVSPAIELITCAAADAPGHII